jgi:hypothetical protein
MQPTTVELLRVIMRFKEKKAAYRVKPRLQPRRSR